MRRNVNHAPGAPGYAEWQQEKEALKQERLRDATEHLKARFGDRFSGQLSSEAEKLDGLIEEDLTPDALIEIARLIEVLNEAVGWAHGDTESARIELKGILGPEVGSKFEWVDEAQLQFAIGPGTMIDLVPNAHSGLLAGWGEDRDRESQIYVWMPEGSRWSGFNRDSSELVKAFEAIVDSGLPLHPAHIQDLARLKGE